MPKLIKVANADKALTKEQKAFNNYIKSIKEAKASFEHFQDVNQWLLGKGESIMGPAQNLLMKAQKDLLIAMDSSPFIEKLSRNLYQKFEAIMQEGLDLMVHEAKDEEMIPLYNRYNKVSFEEEQQRSIVALNNMVATIFGIDIELTKEEIENPALMEEKMNEFKAKQAEKDAERAAKRKKTPKQLEKEAKTKEAEQKLTQTTKKIYLELVKNFHPDQEQDEVERERKTAILQEANAAYANDDFLALLELQVKLFQEREEDLANTSDDTLKYYNKILKEQLQELKYNVNQLNPLMNGHPYGRYYHPTQSWRTEKKMKEEAKMKLAMVEDFENQLKSLKTWQGFKFHIENFEVKEEDEFNISDLFQMFGR